MYLTIITLLFTTFFTPLILAHDPDDYRSIFLYWTNFTHVTPLSKTLEWTGGYGENYASLFFQDNGFQEETFEMVMWAGEGRWDPPLNAAPTGTVTCTIQATAIPPNLEAYQVSNTPPYTESVWDTPNPVAKISCGAPH
ncbi:hypothetical protein M231_00351 [Tremella mesenterica]|uniref:AA1-like domain-containing protein n=1 Tax=Tremella mesenterica TaxID=5217 RepID=A0A4Q1BW31_TREME|nr:uncharacterized protein TREMEDRAFT_63499 [Tremella mesenterica DSM 1558]EIW68327.1 hypothetical protein TREMEDRAFT_63499 [Tremella mesenterica DSM 1558]RXK42361.1 hypothetical protein M231_00351 [Tremella mesenterica]